MQIGHILIKDHIQIFFSESGFRGKDWKDGRTDDGRQVMAKAHITFGQLS
jgi:hypothetical protein